jgi:uncharacterized protein DUF4382
MNRVLQMRGWMFFGLAGSVLLAACGSSDDPTGSGNSVLQIQLTDAPADDIETAEVWISRVYLQPADVGEEQDAERTRVDLFNDPENPKMFDLMLLRAGAVADLTDPIVVPEGEYSQLRAIVDSAVVTLKEGLTFSDDTNSRILKIPSGSTSGIKIKLNADLFAIEGSQVTLLVDFDVAANFKYQGPPSNPNGMIFTPNLKEKSRSQTER